MSGFKTKARTVELLGRKQIRDSVTALAELMKNAYDADAPWLRVEFSTTGSNQHVVIVDTGLGMSQNDIESKWLVLGTNSKTKRANKTSPSGRPLMGAKGIGRLASATLGKQLWMFTKTEESLWNIVFINWDIFENPYISIEDVRVPTRFGVSSQELILRFDSIIAEMLSEQRSNLENPGWYPENDIDGIVAPLLNGIRNSLSKASIEKKDVEKYIASFKCGTILHIDQLHDDWNRYISPISSETRRNDVMLEKMYNRFASFISTFKHTVTEGLPFEVEIYIDGSLWEEDYDFCRFTESEIKRNQVDFVNGVSPSVVVKISKSKVFPALSNLINNSLYWVLNQQIRTILIRFDEASRTLYVEDSGAGIAAANREKIFEPFVSYKPNGRGLGLTIARKVLESQGYRLEVAADTEKVLPGACFKIVFSEDTMEVN